jgi:hypothetical protein
LELISDSIIFIVMVLLSEVLSASFLNKAYEVLRQVFDNMPDYVFDDFIMAENGFFLREYQKFLKKNPTADADDVYEEFSDWADIKWKKKVLEVNPSDFTKQNQKKFSQRNYGNKNPDGIKDDEARIEFQRNLMKTTKPGTNETVVVLNSGSTYKLLEGWHRTMVILSLGNNGNKKPAKWNKVKLNAWIGTGSGVKGVWE